MSINQPDPADELTNDSAHLPSVEEVVARLDRLWADTPREAIGLSHSLVGHRIGGYTILERIGHGSFGIVYRAYDPQLDRELALKIPRPEVLLDEDKLRRFESEAKVVASLDHASIVPIYEAHLNDSTPFIALAYVAGPSLDACLAEQSERIPWREAAEFIADLADAVHYAHERGVIHRDLKPSNILLVARSDSSIESASLKDYQPKLTDFGLAKLAQSGLEDTRSSMLIGTPLYMAPEVLLHSASETTEPTADIYSLGCVLYELLTGRPPIIGANYVQVLDRLRESRPERIQKLRPDVPRDLEAVCLRCLEKDPAARYASARNLADDLRQVARGEPVAAHRASWRQPFRYWRSKPQRILEAGWYAFCVNGVASIWLPILGASLPRFNFLTPEEYSLTLVDLTMAMTTVHLPMTAIGYMAIQRRRWAVWCGAGLSLYATLLLLLGSFGITPVFEAVYRNVPYHAFAAFLQLILMNFAQFILYLFALSAISKISADK